MNSRFAPRFIDAHFIENEVDPPGKGEVPFPPTIDAVANALYKATGKRSYNQPFLGKTRCWDNPGHEVHTEYSP
ncbi:MAG: hypothetical protein KDC28_14465 [Saprospiraceae bacterium]|nr:hypothetical protein [Saprospiraceae bacterium]MCB9317847.1 hypothetical protein [Lewinellaceae bacterium]